ncbi:MAG: two-component system, chemotaxis family, protein-glutamate methylesterase/glutaminase [Sphingomonadales bacterium]|jgi:two-component system chemotaxis response regulator CheB|nr:two-component system, chemotaxis family, protein-glutamate methylesterase/glutaminase [Sphingomonadales bacterium]
MIVDDSAVARSVLARMLAPFADFEVVALAASAEEAVALLGGNRVDIVLLDLDMPGSTGLEALPAIIAKGGGARVLVVSSSTETGSEAAVKALALGAADTLAKPGGEQFADRFSATLAERLRRLVPDGTGQAAPSEAPARAAPVFATSKAHKGRIGCLAIGASTGGLHAISRFLQALPPRIGAPILVTQHLPTTFLPLFARLIENACERRVRVAQDGLLLRADEILLAPGDAHLDLERHGGRVKAKLSSAPVDSGFTPSVDAMLAAVARAYGKSGVGVVLSGMGRDGLAGGRRLAAAGGRILVQDRDSSAVWGMPGALACAGLACCVQPPAALAREIGAWAGAER